MTEFLPRRLYPFTLRPIVNRKSSWEITLTKSGLKVLSPFSYGISLKERICSHREQILSFKGIPIIGRRAAWHVQLKSQRSQVRYPVRPHTFVTPSADSRRVVVTYWGKYVHEVLVNCLGGLSLCRESVVS